MLMVAPSVRVPDTLGQTLHQLALAEGLAAQGVAVTLLCRCGTARSENGVQLEPVPDRGLPGERLLFTRLAAERVRELLGAGGFDLVHDRGYLFAGAGVHEAAQAGVPSVLQIDDNWLRSETTASRLARTWPYLEAARRSCREQVSLATGGFAVSRTLRQQAAHWHPDATGFAAIQNGYESGRFTQEAEPLGIREQLGLDGPLAVFVGALGPWHGTDELLALARALPQLAVVIAGGGYGLALPELPNLHHIGRLERADVPRLLAEADLGLAPYPARDYGFSPLKIFEYMGCHLPVVATALPSVREATAGNALLTPPGEMAAGVKRLLDSPGLMERLGAAGHAFALRERTWERTVTRTLELYARFW
jgi:glycosyltransferase involved in cell wall biosynthesis